MRSWALGFLLGILLLQQCATLPTLGWIMIIILSSLFFIIFSKKYSFFILCIAIGFGFSWAAGYAHWLLAWNLPKELEGKPLVITGYIASLPNQTAHRVTFLFSTTHFQAHSARALIKLSWQTKNKMIHVGEKWKFVVRLKRIHGLLNPGGFDYEAWAFQEGIRAQGYVVNHAENRLLAHPSCHFLLNQLREKIKKSIEKILPRSSTSPWIIALAVGERENISADKWEVLRNTGTNHLMAIAGLHIGIVASLLFLLVNRAWRCSSYLMFKLPAQQVAAIAALVAAILYSALAGFSLPTERACIMLSIALFAMIMRRKILSWQTWSVALFVVLCMNPFSTLTESFWLSFGSVALIIYGIGGRLGPHGLIWKLSRIQWVIALGLIPLSIWLFQQCSLISFVANSIAIPWVGFLVLPFILLGCIFLSISKTISGWFFLFADHTLHLLWSVLVYFSQLSWASWYHVVLSKWILFAACMGVVILLLPTGFTIRYVGMIWFFPLIFYHYPAPKIGEVWFTLLDVGQGLSAVVQTAKHVLVFDTGARLESYDTGESVVAPFLRSMGAKKIDLLVISHKDNDHSGGALALLKQFKVSAIKTSSPENFSSFFATYCLRNQHWQWDGVEFVFLYPSINKLNLDNDSSCVLKITSKNQKNILLTGDIEKIAERELVETNAENLKTDILIAPHHGSKTSALEEFVRYVNPAIVLFPVGYRNRYHFPNPQVAQRYLNLGAKLFETDKNGAIQFNLSEKTSTMMLYRSTQKHFWQDTRGTL